MEPAPEPQPDGPAAEVVLQGQGDLDGQPGDESVQLHSNGQLVAGELQGVVEMSGNEYFMAEQASVSVVVVDAETRGVLVALPIDEDEDPPNRYQLLVPVDGALTRVLNVVAGVYGERRLRFPGDGTARWTEDGWTACERLDYPDRATRQEIVFRAGPDGQMVESERHDTAQVMVCDELAACPFVYVVQDGAATYVGEILRHLRGRDAYAAQTLALPSIDGTSLHLRLTEEKPEITFLDAVWVEQDGVVILPEACGEAGPAYCAADRRSHRMTRGDTLDLRFQLPGSGRPILHASGFYRPVDASAQPE